jgi:hypothetical protein
MWTAELPENAGPDCFIGVIVNGDTIRANTWSGYALTLDLITGKTLATTEIGSISLGLPRGARDCWRSWELRAQRLLTGPHQPERASRTSNREASSLRQLPRLTILAE